ncbi:MAG: ribonuclease H [Bdellovibrionota bacterium]
MSQKFDSVLIFTDGACSGNPGPGGWGAIVALPDGEVTELGDGHPATTNNRMELAGTIAALRFVNKKKAFAKSKIDLYTDSTYVIRGITQWIWGWKKKGWQNAEGGEVLNRDLWEALLEMVSARDAAGKINWLYSRGHVGTPGNERCDEIAVAFSKNKHVDLYEGPLLQYRVAIYDVPEDSTLPEMRPKTEKKAAYSYLSLLGGEVWRHQDWGSCERRVKGKSGAKFKKAMAASEEAKILAEWGLSAKTVIKE